MGTGMATKHSWGNFFKHMGELVYLEFCHEKSTTDKECPDKECPDKEYPLSLYGYYDMINANKFVELHNKLVDSDCTPRGEHEKLDDWINRFKESSIKELEDSGINVNDDDLKNFAEIVSNKLHELSDVMDLEGDVKREDLLEKIRSEAKSIPRVWGDGNGCVKDILDKLLKIEKVKSKTE